MHAVAIAFNYRNVRLWRPRWSNLSTGNITTYSMTRGLYHSCGDTYYQALLIPNRMGLGDHVVHPAARCHMFMRWERKRFLSLIKTISYYFLPRPADSRHLPRQHDQPSAVLIIKEQGLCTTTHYYTPDPCPRLQLTVPTFDFELILRLPADYHSALTATCIRGGSWKCAKGH